MHTLIEEGDGWTAELLRDDSDTAKSRSNNATAHSLEEKLQGCGFLKLKRRFNGYTAEIRYEEQLYDEKVSVEAVVFENKLGPSRDETNPGTLYFRQREFVGTSCKAEAAHYANELKRDINDRYFLKLQKIPKQKTA